MSVRLAVSPGGVPGVGWAHGREGVSAASHHGVLPVGTCCLDFGVDLRSSVRHVPAHGDTPITHSSRARVAMPSRISRHAQGRPQEDTSAAACTGERCPRLWPHVSVNRTWAARR
jgi:hypothetical protein